MKKKFVSAFTLRAIYKKGFTNGSTVWRYCFYLALVFKLLKWLFSKPSPEVIEEFELLPGQYSVTVKEKSKRKMRKSS